jgi:hypothetical protein
MVPEVLIDAEPTYCIKINYDWIRHVWGILDALDQPDAWVGNPELQEFARSEVRRLMASVYECSEIGGNMGCIIGEIKMIMPGVDVPEGCLVLNGSYHRREDYPDLWDALPDTILGHNVRLVNFDPCIEEIDPCVGDWIFLPNMAQHTLIGSGTTRVGGPWDAAGTLVTGVAPGANGGAETHMLLTAEMPSHDHDMTFRINATEFGSSNIGVVSATGTLFTNANPIENTGGGQPHDNMPPYFAVNFCIVAACTVGEPIMTTFRLRQNPENDCQLEQSLNNGASWSLAYDYSLCAPTSDILTIIDAITALTDLINDLIDIYDGTPASIDPILDYGDANDGFRDDALCFAVYLFVRWCAEAAKDAHDKSFDESSNIIDSIGNLLVGAGGAIITLGGITLLGTPLAPIVVLSGLMFKGAAFLDPIFDTSPEFGETELEDVACEMLSHISGDTVTYAAFSTSLDSRGVLPQDSESLAQIVIYALSDVPAYLAFLKFFAEIIPAAIEGIEIYCPCTEPAIEIVNMPANIAAGVTTAFMSDDLKTYRLEMSSECMFDLPGTTSRFDAFYNTNNAWSTQFEGGIRLDGTSLVALFGAPGYSTVHEYTQTGVPGTGAPFVFNFGDSNYTDNSGTIEIAIYEE